MIHVQPLTETESEIFILKTANLLFLLSEFHF